MAITIRNKETCQLIRELATLLGVSMEKAVYIAVKRELEMLKAGKASGSSDEAG